MQKERERGRGREREREIGNFCVELGEEEEEVKSKVCRKISKMLVEPKEIDSSGERL